MEQEVEGGDPRQGLLAFAAGIRGMLEALPLDGDASRAERLLIQVLPAGAVARQVNRRSGHLAHIEDELGFLPRDLAHLGRQGDGGPYLEGLEEELQELDVEVD